MKKFLILIILILFLFLPIISLALELEYPKIGDIEVKLGMDLNALIAWFYFFIIRIAGVIAFVMLVWAGFLWMTSTGDASKTTEAKDRIYSAFLGLIIILTAHLILRTINPELIMLRDIRLPQPPAITPPRDLRPLQPVLTPPPALGTTEVIHWNGMRTIFPIGAYATVIDFKTGNSFRVRRGAGRLHADVEAVTSHDVNIMRNFCDPDGNGNWEEDCRRRAIIVEITERDGIKRRFAASMYGQPHAPDHIPNNNMNGHFCIHFCGSRSHPAQGSPDPFPDKFHQLNVGIVSELSREQLRVKNCIFP